MRTFEAQIAGAKLELEKTIAPEPKVTARVSFGPLAREQALPVEMLRRLRDWLTEALG